ncbi:MAG: helix-turn-helix transcriptional regulator [Armatimonadetes bacterium]|nr:helix-turn-helix transcriptional regulator [Armatimonadota bacterium]
MEMSEIARTRQAIGKRIIARRSELGLSQVQAANVLGMTRSTYAQYEVGYIDIPSSRLIQICTTLDMTPDHILGLGAGDAEAALARARTQLQGIAETLGLTCAPLPADAAPE